MATANIKILADVTGLGERMEFVESFDVSTDPTVFTHQYRIQATSDTAEALALGDVSTEHMVIIKAVTNDMDVDCDYSATFDADINIPQGEVAIFKPSGTVYIKNATAAETVTYEYWVLGTS